MSDRKLSYQDLLEIIRLVEGSPQFEDFRLKYDGVEIELSKSGRLNQDARAGAAGPAAFVTAAAPQSAATAAPSAGAAPQAKPAGSATVIPAGMMAVKAPMVGTFYRSPEPGAKPFVEVGAKVTKESVVCILEVMKLMNSLTAETNGVITEILVADGQTVEYGQPLMLIKPGG